MIEFTWGAKSILPIGFDPSFACVHWGWSLFELSVLSQLRLYVSLHHLTIRIILALKDFFNFMPPRQNAYHFWIILFLIPRIAESPFQVTSPAVRNGWTWVLSHFAHLCSGDSLDSCRNCDKVEVEKSQPHEVMNAKLYIGHRCISASIYMNLDAFLRPLISCNKW